jgi:predicted nucleic acid-binding protein
MRLAVLDTNVVVSAGIRPGSPPAKLMMDWVLEGLVQTVTCPSIAAEYREVLHRGRFARYGFPPQWLDFLLEESLQLPDPPPWEEALPDPKDGPFLALAQAAGAWLVSGNLKHFPSSARRKVKVLSPADYLAWLERGPSGYAGR